jgi:hypothetical protein
MTEPATITCYITNGTSTSKGNGPGVAADLPAEEALWLIGQGLAVRGDQPPMGMEGHEGPVGTPNPVTP